MATQQPTFEPPMAVEHLEAADWESLHPDLLTLVLSFLPLRDLIRAATISKTWRLSAAQAAHNQRPHLPWLWSSGTRNMYSLSDGRYYDLHLPEDLASDGLERCQGLSSEGAFKTIEDWIVALALHEECDEEKNDLYNYRIFKYFLHNPFSAARIELPTFVESLHNLTSEHHIVLSSSPQSPDCMAVILDSSQDLRLCYVGADGWSVVTCDGKYVDAVFNRETLYLISHKGALEVVDMASFKINSLLPAPPDPPFPDWLKESFRYMRRSKAGRYGERRYSLMVCEGEVLMMFSTFDVSVNGERFLPVALYRANLESGRWEIAKSLNGLCIFHGVDWFVTTRPAKSLGIEEDSVYVVEFRKEYVRFDVVNQRFVDECFRNIGKECNIWFDSFSPFCPDRRPLYMLTPKYKF